MRPTFARGLHVLSTVGMWRTFDEHRKQRFCSVRASFRVARGFGCRDYRDRSREYRRGFQQHTAIVGNVVAQKLEHAINACLRINNRFECLSDVV